jgi:glycosyltransferase involved in cell wall biosynthesis
VKPRLLLITEIIAPYRTPVFNALARRDEIDLHVVFLSETDPSLRQWQVSKDEIQFEYEVLSSYRWRVGKFNGLINRGVRRALEKAQPHAILCGGYNYLASWQALAWARKRNIPFLLWVESTAADQRSKFPWVESLKRSFLSRCRAFVVPGNASQQYLGHLGVEADTVFRAPNAVDNALFAEGAARARAQAAVLRQQLNLPDQCFLFVGRLVRAKGIFELLKAYAKLDASLRRAMGLVIVGEGPDGGQVRERASRISDGNIQFPGFVQKEGLPNYYALADALVFPTHSDTWGFVVNEAMACALPVIASEVAGCVPDLVQDGWNGRLVRPRDAAALAAAMTEFASQGRERLREMGERSAQRISAYSPELCAAGIARAVLTCV